jgi:hypothetical protein
MEFRLKDLLAQHITVRLGLTNSRSQNSINGLLESGDGRESGSKDK